MARCLFTASDFGDRASQEHAPPRAMGGKLRSRRSVSRDFNSRSGHTIDSRLLDIWFLVCRELSPLMPEGGTEKTLRVRHAGRRFVVGPGPVVSEEGRPVEIADGTGKVAQLIGPVVRDLRRHARRHPHIAGAPVTMGASEHGGRLLAIERLPLLNPPAEVAALKCVLGAFDIAHNAAPTSWVRSQATHRARELVAAAVRGEDIAGLGASEVLRGVDYGLATPLSAIARASGAMLGRFEHVVFAQGPGDADD